MVIKQKVTKKENSTRSFIEANEDIINDVINRGGKTTLENQREGEEETRFTLRLPSKLIDSLDKHRSKRMGNISRNQWIVEAIADKLASK